MSAADPFDTGRLRAGVLAAWRDSPTRLREDAATEADLVRAGYRDRLLTELAQNAADAAAKAGVPGRMTVRLAGRTLHVSNTGAPLDLAGVHALTALRASGKDDATVGRFGVGFTAVLSVSDDLEVRSTTGSLHFSRDLTSAALHDNGIRLPNVGAEQSGPTGGTAPSPPPDGARQFAPPALRLAWPLDTAPEPGADTEVVLRLRADVDTAALLAGMRAEAADLLLELPALHGIRIEDDEIVSARTELGNGLQELRIDGPGFDRRIWWQFTTTRARWLLPVRAGRPVPAGEDVLRAPTRSDEELSLPAILIATIPMQPDRRRLLPGARVAELAAGYADFARALPPADRLVLVPRPGFARSEVDGLLREALIEQLRTHSWLPIVTNPATTTDTPLESGSGWDDPAADRARSQSAAVATRESAAPLADLDRAPGPGAATLGSDSGRGDLDQAASTGTTGYTTAPDPMAHVPPTNPLLDDPHLRPEPSGDTAVPTRATVFTGLTQDLADLLDDVIGPLVIPELSDRAHSEALNVLDVPRLGLARLAEVSGGLERGPHWWHRLYTALEPFVVDPLSAEELGALAVPLADGRVVTGPRTVVLDDQLAEPIPVHWSRLAHPVAAHPLLARLGARSATAEDLLNDPGLRAELEDHPDDADIVDAVLRLASHANPALLPPWLGMLELPDSAGESRPADELLLPDAPLYPLLVEDAPFGTLDKAFAEAYDAEALRAIGVGWDFAIVTEADPTGPDHDLDDEEQWWAGLASDPPELRAVRDLDLVDEIAWPDALHQLVSEPATRRLLRDRDGYTAWWLRRHAHIDGTPLGLLRHPDDTEFAGLLHEFAFEGFAPTDLDALRAVFADPAAMPPELAAALLEALADPAKTPAPETISRTHGRLAAAVTAGRLEVAELELPPRVRALSGAVIDPADAVVLDQPWFAFALPPERVVFGDTEHAAALATLLDLPRASEAVRAEVLGPGRRTTWAAAPLGAVLREMFTLPTRNGDLVLHDELRVRLDGAAQGTVEVPWWREGETTHLRLPEVR
ncbi:ATP-binding protein [Nocardia sp. NPDC048505]|uniref:sacsin N-terminal ATP-binding-like domain-containing protein n=1 Tax=unclassified Nocardia TaxID=2637762 RepID=UPI0033CA31D7